MDLASVRSRLQSILAQVIGEQESRPRKAGDLDPSADFATLGVNSVDLMEFVLRVEQEFHVDLLGEMQPEELPTSLDGWAQFLHRRIEQSPSP